jgi:putative transposase
MLYDQTTRQKPSGAAAHPPSALVRYIHLNPVQAGAVKQPEDYRWGSHRFYLEAKGAPSWLNTAEALGQIGGRKAFHEFVLSGNEESLERYYKAERQSPILGSSQWGPL